MINNLALDPDTGDLLETGGQIQEVTGLEAIAQGIKSDLRLFLGEYWLDRSRGIPYKEVVFNKQTDISLVNSLFRAEIQRREDVVELTTYTGTFIPGTRTLRIEFSAKTNQGFLEDRELII